MSKEWPEPEKSKSIKAEQELKMIEEHFDKGEWAGVAEELKELNQALAEGDVIDKEAFNTLRKKIEGTDIPDEYVGEIKEQFGWIEDKLEKQG